MRIQCPRLQEVTECALGTPTGHKHLRLALRYRNEVLILPEAVVAAVVRAYVTLKTHPYRRALHLRLTEAAGGKSGYAELQLLETSLKDDQIEAQLACWLQQAE